MTGQSRGQGRKRILFVAEAVTLAHAVRLLVLARALDPERYEIHFASARFDDLAFRGTTFRRWPLYSLPPEQFLRSVDTGSRLFDEPTLARYVEDDLRVLREVRPHLVVGDFRLSLAVSAPVAGVPYAALMNAHWSPYAPGRLPIPEVPLVRALGPKLAGLLFRLAEPLVSAHFARPLNRLRRRHSLAPLGGLREANTWGDFTLYADTPGLVPTRNLPPNHRYLGPVLWSPDLPLPAWWEQVPKDRPAIYVTLGSSGPADRLPQLVAALASLPVEVLVATASRGGELPTLPNVWSAPYLPGQQAAVRSVLVVCNGGSATAYQALAEGVPALGICSNMDQFMTMNCIEKAGAGLWLRAGRLQGGAVAAVAQRLLGRGEYREAAHRIADEFRRHDARSIFSEFVRQAVGPRDLCPPEAAMQVRPVAIP